MRRGVQMKSETVYKILAGLAAFAAIACAVALVLMTPEGVLW